MPKYLKLLIYFFYSITLSLNFLSFKLFAFESKEFKNNFVTAKIIIASIQNNQGYGFISLNIKNNYKTYWKTAGEVGFSSYFDIENSNLNSIALYFLPPKRYKDAYSYQSYIYKNQVYIPFIFKLKNNQKNLNFNVKLYFAVCNDVCIPNEATFNFQLKSNYKNNKNLTKFNQLLQQVPQKIAPKQIDFKLFYYQDYIEVSFNFNNKLTKTSNNFKNNLPTDILIESENFIFYQPKITFNNKTQLITAKIPFKSLETEQTPSQNLPQNQKNLQEPLIITIVNSAKSYELNYNLQYTLSQNTKSTDKSQTQNNSPTNYYLIFLFAFLGGLILNIMPCVLPVISLKIGQLTNTNNKISTNKQLLLTILGLISSLLFLGLLIFILKQAGEVIGWGFHFQNPIFITIMLLILLSFTFSQLGLINMNLSNQSSGFLNNILNKLSPNHWLFHFLYGIIITLLATPCTAPFLGTSIAFALTQGFITIIGIFFAVSLGLSFPYILLLFIPKNLIIIPKGGLWLNYVKYFAAFLLYASSIWLYYVLINQITIISASIIFICLHLIILGFIKTSFKKIFLILLIFLFIFVICIKDMGISKDIKQEKKHLIWHNLDETMFADITINQNKIIFIDITASWCLTCKFNEFNVLSKSEVTEALSKENIYLIKEDITKPNPKIMKFIYSNHKSGIPFYAIIKQGKIEILSEILNKETLIKKLKG